MNRRKGLATTFIFFLVSLFLIESAVALTLKGARSDVSETQRRKRNSTNVVNIFRTIFARCHGADGLVETPLRLTDQAPSFANYRWGRATPMSTVPKSP